MKGVILFAIVGLLAAGVCATGIQFEQLDPKAVLAEFDATPFGNTLVSMIAVHLSTNGPLDELIVLLQNVDSSIKKAQKEADEKNVQVQGECDTQIGGFRRQISTATGAITQFTTTRDSTQASLDVASQDLRETLASLQTNAQRLSQGQAERDAQHQQYAKSQGEAEAAIKALDAALQLIGHLQSGSSFVQLKKRFDKVTSDLLEVARGSKSQSHLYTPLIEALAELAQKATPETLQKITALFNKLRSKFVKSQQVGTQTENTQMTAWTSLKVDLETEKDALQDKRRGLESQIDGYNKVISDCVKAIQYNQGQLKNAKDNLRRTKKYCKIQADTYKKNSAERTRELSIIQKAVQFFRNRAKGISDAIKNSRGL